MKEQGSKSRLDKLVENTGTELAAKSNRRGFLSKVVGAASATLFSGTVILGEKIEAKAEPYGCFSQYGANVCYYDRICASWVTWWVPLKKGPSWDSPDVAADVQYTAGWGLGIISNNMTPTTGCPNYPGMRAAVNGFRWGFVNMPPGGPTYRAFGWIPDNVLTQAYGWNSCGPAGYDFDCERSKSVCPSWHGCGGQQNPTYYVSGANATVANNDWDKTCLRLAPDGTAVNWLVANDKVRRDGYNMFGGINWACVTAVCCAWTPNGCKGWCKDTGLSFYGGDLTSCPGTGNCGY